MAIPDTDVINTVIEVIAPACSDKDVETEQVLDPESEETLQFVAGQLRKKKKRQAEEELLRDGKKSTNPVYPKARACKKL